MAGPESRDYFWLQGRLGNPFGFHLRVRLTMKHILRRKVSQSGAARHPSQLLPQPDPCNKTHRHPLRLFILPTARPPRLLRHSSLQLSQLDLSPNASLKRDFLPSHPVIPYARPCGTENVAEIVPTCLHLSTRDYF